METVAEYYDRMRPVYSRVWAEDPHFGYFEPGRASTLADATESYTRRLASVIMDVVPLSRAGSLSVVELCCGAGPFAQELRRRRVEGVYRGVDASAGQLREFARREGATSAALSVETFEQDAGEFLVHFAARSAVDVVVCQDSFYHLTNKGDVLRSASEILRPGGVIAVSDLAIREECVDDSEWQAAFARRQPSVNALRFRRDGYEFEDLLPSDMNLLGRWNMSHQLQRTYAAAEVSARAIGEHRLADAFATMTMLARRDRIRLMWWVAGKRPIGPEPTGESLVRFTGGPRGVQFASADPEADPEREVRFPVLASSSFSVAAGDRIAVIGRNGSGKSTLLRILQGIEPRNADEYSCSVRPGIRVCSVEQAPTLFDELTVRVLLSSVSRAASRVARGGADAAWCIDRLNLAATANRRIGILSGGQRQRVAIAAALCAAADVLLLDEPFSAQDGWNRELIVQTIMEFCSTRPNVAVVLVSHREKEAEMLQTQLVEVCSSGIIAI